MDCIIDVNEVEKVFILSKLKACLVGFENFDETGDYLSITWSVVDSSAWIIVIRGGAD